MTLGGAKNMVWEENKASGEVRHWCEKVGGWCERRDGWRGLERLGPYIAAGSPPSGEHFPESIIGNLSSLLWLLLDTWRRRPEDSVRWILPRFCSRPSFCSSFCTFRLAEGAVPDVWDGGALDLGAGEVHPDAARGALDHRLSPVRLFAVARHVPIVLWILVRNEGVWALGRALKYTVVLAARHVALRPASCASQRRARVTPSQLILSQRLFIVFIIEDHFAEHQKVLRRSPSSMCSLIHRGSRVVLSQLWSFEHVGVGCL